VTLRQGLSDLANLVNGITPQTRGRKFERWLNKLLAQSDLNPRTSFRPEGEEVDGSFMHAGRAHLIEAKWWADEVPASAIYQFKGKVDGKLVGTVGVFISMSGYSADSVDALRVGKDLNVILFDSSDVHAATEVGFTSVLEFKLRIAAEQGEVFVPYIAPAPKTSKVDATGDGSTSTGTHSNDLTVVVEGPRDEVIIRGIIENLRKRSIPTRDLNILVARGVMGISHVAAAAAEARGGDVLAIADSDGSRFALPHQELLEGHKIEMIIVDPWIEQWLSFSSPAEARKLGGGEIYSRATAIDIDDVTLRDKEFGRLIRKLSA
jgi:hypothetical protein